MKKIIAVVLTLIMITGLCACGSKAVYTIHVVDESGAAVSGVRVQMCDDSSCMSSETDENGTAIYENDVPNLEVHILGAPEGYEYDSEAVYTMDKNNRELTITLSSN